jgi:replicative DNA helicase
MPRKQSIIYRDLSQSLGKLPPSAIDLEESVLGALLLEQKAIMEVAGFLKESHFCKEANIQIYAAIMQMFSIGSPIDMRTVVDQMRKNGKLEISGGAYYIAELTSKVSSSANIEYHARVIVEMAIKRELIMLASQIHGKAYEETTDVFELMDFVSLSLEGISDDSLKSNNELSVKEISVGVIKEIENRMMGKASGTPSGFKRIDNIIRLQSGNLIIIGGRPGQGKSVLAFQILQNISMTFGLPVGAFSLEMPKSQVVDRLGCSISEVPSDRIKDGKLDAYEFSRVIDAHGELSKGVYQIDDTPALHISDLRVRVKSMKQRHNIVGIVVDYIQLMRGLILDVQMTRDQELGNVSRGLKAIAKENDIFVIAISSLSRAVETRGGDKRPILSDLRESGSLESDADVVAFLYRPEYYKIMTDEDGYPTHGLAEFIVAKNRGGALGTAKLKFVGSITKFKDWEHEPNKIDYTSGVKSPVADENRDDSSPF